MSEGLIVAVLSMLGTLIGSLGGIMASNKLVSFRLNQLETKVDKHNHLVERMAVVERDQKTLFRLHDELKEEMEREH